MTRCQQDIPRHFAVLPQFLERHASRWVGPGQGGESIVLSRGLPCGCCDREAFRGGLQLEVAFQAPLGTAEIRQSALQSLEFAPSGKLLGCFCAMSRQDAMTIDDNWWPSSCSGCHHQVCESVTAEDLPCPCRPQIPRGSWQFLEGQAAKPENLSRPHCWCSPVL